MAIHKLDLGEFDEIDYHLIAIHTSLEDYRLAYFINQKMGLNLSKNKNEIQITIKNYQSKRKKHRGFRCFYYLYVCYLVQLQSLSCTFSYLN